MHEHLDEMGLIHMNGRIYDPLIGRFMSADPFIQAPENLQSHNRFAYVMNNPLAYTDPSGYFSLKKLFRLAIAVVVGIATGGAASAWYLATTQVCTAYTMTIAAAIGGAAGGFMTGLIASGGDLKAAFQGALSGGVFGGVGGHFAAGTTASYVGHATAGCLTSVAGGGKCGSGMVSALFGKYTTNWIGDNTNIQSDLAKGVATTVAGGVGSVIAGGKFESGAVTGAFGYMYNYCSNGVCTTKLEQTLYDWMPGYKAGTLVYNQTMGDGSWTGWEIVDAASLGVGLAGKGISAGLDAGSKSVLWAGRGASQEAALLGTPINKTPIGNVLDKLDSAGKLPFRNFVWEQASAVYATNAAAAMKVVPVVIRFNTPASILYRIELPILMKNGVQIAPK
jgi:RHS repeat-associated protein